MKRYGKDELKRFDPNEGTKQEGQEDQATGNDAPPASEQAPGASDNAGE